MSYSFYLAGSHGVPRNHHAILVNTNTDSNGFAFQMTGDIQRDTVFDRKNTEEPNESASFVAKEYIGTISKNDIAQVQPVVKILPPPKQFERASRLNPSEPLRRFYESMKEAI